MHLILVHIGNDFPFYLNDCIQQIRFVCNIEIIVLIDAKHIKFINNVTNLKLISLDSITESGFTKTYLTSTILDGTCRDGFWLSTSLRFFLIHDYIAQNKLIDIFHIEYDNLIYYDFTKLLPLFQKSQISMILDAPNRCIPSFLYFKNSDSMIGLLQQLITSGIHNENDMTALAHFANKNPTTVIRLPIIYPEYEGIDLSYSEGLKTFGVLFDGAAIGQFIGGVDPNNLQGDTRGFVNETTVFKADRVNITWKTRDNMIFPYLNEHPLVNLHIHCKNLRRYMSKKIDFITGEKIQMLCDVYCGLPEDFAYNPKIAIQKSLHYDLSKMPPKIWDNPKLVFCYSHRLREFRHLLNVSVNKMILFCHNSDENINGSYADIVDHPNIVAMYSQNVIYDHPKLLCLPIGIANSMWSHGNLAQLENIINLNIKKTEKVYFYFNMYTNIADRSKCKESFEKLGFTFGKKMAYDDYLKTLASCKFAICPTGNGVDSHRIWECLYLGVIPIVLKNEFTIKISKIYPCILLEKWSDFDYEKYNESWRYIPYMDTLSMGSLANRHGHSLGPK